MSNQDSTQGGSTKATRRVAEWINLIQERGACTSTAGNKRAWNDEIYEEGERYRTGQNGKEIYMLQKWGNGMRKEKVRCRTELTETPRWTKNQRGEFEKIETEDMEMNDYECLMRAIEWVTTNEMTKWLEEERGRIESTYERATEEERETTRQEERESEEWTTGPERRLRERLGLTTEAARKRTRKGREASEVPQTDNGEEAKSVAWGENSSDNMSDEGTPYEGVCETEPDEEETESVKAVTMARGRAEIEEDERKAREAEMAAEAVRAYRGEQPEVPEGDLLGIDTEMAGTEERENGEVSDMEWQQDQEEWSRIAKEEAEKAGYVGSKEGIAEAVERRAGGASGTRKRGRSTEDVGQKTSGNAGRGIRVHANLKRSITQEAVRGLMASMHANMGNERSEKKTPQERDQAARESWEKAEEKRREKGKTREGEGTPPGLTLADIHGMLRQALGRINDLEGEVRQMRRQLGEGAHQQEERGPPPPIPPRNQQSVRPHPHRAPPPPWAGATRRGQGTGGWERAPGGSRGGTTYEVPTEEELEKRKAGWVAQREAKNKAVREEELKRGREAADVVVIVPDSQEEVEETDEAGLKAMAIEAGIPEEQVREVKVVAGRLRVKVETGKAEEVVRKVNEGKGGQARSLEQWAGIVIFDMEVEEWGKTGGMEALREKIQREWKITLMKTPRWLARRENWQGNPTKSSVVIHVARASEREEILKRRTTLRLEGGKLTADRPPEMRPFQQAGRALDQRHERMTGDNKRCNTCTKVGHGWWQCPESRNPANKRCGLCGKMGHTTFWHPCGTKGCRNRGRCNTHKASEARERRCAECNGNHEVEDHRNIRVAL